MKWDERCREIDKWMVPAEYQNEHTRVLGCFVWEILMKWPNTKSHPTAHYFQRQHQWHFIFISGPEAEKYTYKYAHK